MTNYIMRDFSLLRDFRSVSWGATLQFNLVRAFCAGIPLGVITAFTPHPWGAWALLLYPLLWPLVWLIFLLPMALVIRVIAPFFPPAGFFNLLVGVIQGLGDPLVCLLHKFAPRLVPMQRPPLFSPQIGIMLLKPEETQEAAVSDERFGRR